MPRDKKGGLARVDAPARKYAIVFFCVVALVVIFQKVKPTASKRDLAQLSPSPTGDRDWEAGTETITRIKELGTGRTVVEQFMLTAVDKNHPDLEMRQAARRIKWHVMSSLGRWEQGNIVTAVRSGEDGGSYKESYQVDFKYVKKKTEWVSSRRSAFISDTGHFVVSFEIENIRTGDKNRITAELHNCYDNRIGILEGEVHSLSDGTKSELKARISRYLPGS